jgi:hypothetical protein
MFATTEILLRFSLRSAHLAEIAAAQLWIQRFGADCSLSSTWLSKQVRRLVVEVIEDRR